MPIGALASAGIALGSSLLSQLFGNSAAQKQAKDQNQLNMDNWLKQQEYNSPKNQMNRFSEAGLNPQLIYGQGTPGNATSAPVSQAKPRFAPQIDGGAIMQNAVQIQQLQQTVENLKSNQELIQANEQLKKEQTTLTANQNEWYDLLSSNKIAFTKSNIGLNKVRELVGLSQVDKMDSDIMLNKQKMAFTGNEDLRQESLNKARITQITSQTALSNAQKLKVLVDTELQKINKAYLAPMLSSVINKNREAATNMIMSQGTEYDRRNVLRTQAALNQIKLDGYISEQALQLLTSVGGLYIKAAPKTILHKSQKR